MIMNYDADTYVDSREVGIALFVWFCSPNYSLVVRQNRYKVHEHEILY